MKNRKPHLTALSLFWLLLDEKELTLLFLKRSGGGGGEGVDRGGGGKTCQGLGGKCKGSISLGT